MIGMTLGFAADGRHHAGSFRRLAPGRVDHWFRRLQLVSAAAYSLVHGANDAQKTMGIIAGALLAGGYLELVDGKLPIPWVIMAAHAAIASARCRGGWRIIHTMGSRSRSCSRSAASPPRPARAISMFTATASRRAGQHHAHDHRRDHRRRVDPTPVGRALGRRRTDRLGVGAHHTRVGVHRRRRLLGRGAHDRTVEGRRQKAEGRTMSFLPSPFPLLPCSVCRQLDREDRAAFAAVRGADPAIVQFDEVLDDGQAQARFRPGSRSLRERALSTR